MAKLKEGSTVGGQEITTTGDFKTINNTSILGNGNITTPNTTYNEISAANINNATSSTVGLITGRRMKAAIDNRMGAYSIQKNGTDGAGIINFKT